MLGELLKKTGRNTLVYGLGGIAGRIVSFLLIPLYTRYLTPGDYGTIELLDLTGSVIGMFAGIGLGSVVLPTKTGHLI